MRTNEHIPVDYLLENRGKKWMIGDVIIDGVSTVETYHSSFRPILKRSLFRCSHSEDGDSEKGRERSYR